MIKKVLIIRCGALGDLVYSTSVIDALKLEFGEDTVIDFVSTPGSSTLLNYDDRVNQVFPLKHKKVPVILSRQKKDIIKYSQKNPYDFLINFEYGKQFKSLIDKIEAKEKVGAIVENIEIDLTINRGERHKNFFKRIISEDNLMKSNPKVPFLDFSLIQEKYSLDNNYIVLSLSNSHVNKKGVNHRAWKNEHWIELIERLSNKMQVVIVGAKGEEIFFQKIQPYPDNVVDLVGKNNILDLNSVIKSAKAVVCTDSAVGHISAALNTPLFVLMGPNSTISDSPYQTKENSVKIISSNVECSPCYNSDEMKNCTDNKCMSEISVEMVYNCVMSYDITNNNI